MEVFLAILGLFIVGLLGTSRFAYRFRRSRFMAALVGGGWLSVVVGALLGPEVTGLITRETVYQTVPLLTVGLGWIGFIVGFQIRLSLLKQIPASMYTAVVLDAAITVAAVGALAYVGLRTWVGDAPLPELWLALAVLVTATLGWKMELRSVRLNRVAAASMSLRVSGSLLAVLAIVIFGIATKAVGRDPDGTMVFLPERGTLKLVHTLLLAGAIGVVGRILIRLAGSKFGHQLAVFLGIVAFTAGSAKQIGVSPLITTMLAGFVFANVNARGLVAFERFIFRAEHAMAVVFGMLAGILLDPSIGPPGVLLACALVVLRAIYKPLIVRKTYRGGPGGPDPDTREALGFATVRQSPLMLVLGVSLLLVEPSIFHKQILSVLVIAGIMSEFIPVIAGVAHHHHHHHADDHPAVADPEGDAT